MDVVGSLTVQIVVNNQELEGVETDGGSAAASNGPAFAEDEMDPSCTASCTASLVLHLLCTQATTSNVETSNLVKAS
jgi:hypothetical protein